MADKTIEQQLSEATAMIGNQDTLIKEQGQQILDQTNRAESAEKSLKSLKDAAKKSGVSEKIEVEPDCFGEYPETAKKVTRKCRVCKFAQKCKVVENK